jgi:hypothetical protein
MRSRTLCSRLELWFPRIVEGSYAASRLGAVVS